MIDAKKPIKVLIAVPSGTHWLADFGMCLLKAIMRYLHEPLNGQKIHDCQVVNIKGSLLPTSRLNAVKAAKETGATHLLFIDTDHVFPTDLMHRLLEHNKDVVSVNCATKSIPANTTARLYNPVDPQGTVVYSKPDTKPNLQQVWRVGTGVMLITVKALKKIPHDCFAVKYMEDRDVYQGEDWTMCEAFEKAGVPIYIDHQLSREIGHLGIFDYGHDLTGLNEKRILHAT